MKKLLIVTGILVAAVIGFVQLFPERALQAEYARQRLLHHGDATFARFADMFHHRMVSLFYRAWAQAKPCVQHDRPQQDRFSLQKPNQMR